ncbi:MAG TPA: acetyl-CoA acetyltransferase [Vineibacter sp.]|nr:acetyl-CoA acetyltransferase [Vineibacter sp.]
MDRTAIDERTPVLVGCGDVTDAATAAEVGRSPFDLISQAARLALDDAGAPKLAAAIDTLAMLRLFSDSSPRFRTKLGASTNPPRSISRRLGIDPGRHIYTSAGGNMPQYLVNLFSEQIARGEMRGALIVGGEALRTQFHAERAGIGVSWAEDPGGTPEALGDSRRAWSDHEELHGMRAAIVMYPLIENAIRGDRKRTVAAHVQAMGRLFAQFAAVAAANPLATRREGYSADRLAAVDADNRWIGFPYPRLMNANAYIDQAAAIVMVSAGMARQLGIPEEKWVFLHGCADGNDHWFLSERERLGRSPAIRRGVRQALDMAGLTLADIDMFDVYSCFPSAVEIACEEIGLAEDDPRGLTITGGLPYFGGPGNSYVLHSISEMVRQARRRRGKFGLVTANGNYVTKHSWGIYSTTPTTRPWQREDPKALQAELDGLPRAPFTETPRGAAHVESYTIMYGKNGPDFGVVIGREDETGRRFLANVPRDPATLADLQDKESLNRAGTVAREGKLNVFRPA